MLTRFLGGLLARWNGDPAVNRAECPEAVQAALRGTFQLSSPRTGALLGPEEREEPAPAAAPVPVLEAPLLLFPPRRRSESWPAVEEEDPGGLSGWPSQSGH